MAFQIYIKNLHLKSTFQFKISNQHFNSTFQFKFSNQHFKSTFQFNISIQHLNSTFQHHFNIISTSFQRQTSKVDPGVRLLKQDSSLIMFSLNMLDSSVFLQSHSLIKCLRQTDKPSPTDAIAANNKCDKTPDLGLTHSHSHVSGTSSATLSTKQQQDEDYWATKQYSGHITTLAWMLRTIQMISSFENLFILYSLLSPKFMCNKRKLYDTFSKVSEESKIFTNAMLR